MRNISKEMSRISDGRKVSKMKCKFLIPFVVAAMAALLSPPLASAAAILDTELASFAVLGATPDVTNTGATTITGNLGVSPALSITGMETITINSVPATGAGAAFVYLGGPTAGLAQTQLGIARTNLGLLGSGTTLGLDLAGLVLTPGVYTVPGGGSNLTGTLTLNGLGLSNPFWVFQMSSTLITSPNSSVIFSNYPGSGAGLYWNVGSSATIDTATTFEGNILALTSIALKTGATIGCGRALANTGEVTLDTNTIGIGCLGTGLAFGTDTGTGGTVVEDTTTTGGGPGGGTVVAGPGPAPIPEPGTMMLLGSGLVGLAGWGRKKLRK